MAKNKEFESTRKLVILSFVMVLLLPPLGIILGAIALYLSRGYKGSRIRKWAVVSIIINLLVGVSFYYFLYKIGWLFCEVDCGI
ncbi:TPA: hypothetical protein DIS56_04020 [Candidatus Saccharibacteria bacterium]|nr:MAG: hypothetical protein UX30_C0003G0037 [Candidatus Saccharibacteria bacterium GW2011_GWA2_46_10]OGL36362.1 MAG: hypothetical protein A3F05_01265 [Candidatus Saccharibacteria bacterium RIFCSPHIGHO2_12_FULL_47_17]HCM52262.1 hypothetical protein [Candidatus Saccharibacteria bacterium]